MTEGEKIQKIKNFMESKNYRLIAESNNKIGHFIKNNEHIHCDVDYENEQYMFFYVTKRLVKIMGSWFSSPEDLRFEQFENNVLFVVYNGGLEK